MKWEAKINPHKFELINTLSIPGIFHDSEMMEKIAERTPGFNPDTDVLYHAGSGYEGETYTAYVEVYRPIKPKLKQTTAKRYNSGKPELVDIFKYIPQDAMLEEAAVWKMGAEKYGMNNWEKLWGDDTVKVVMSSLLRHAEAIVRGEINDKESGKQHAAHIRCNAAMLLRYFSKDNDK